MVLLHSNEGCSRPNYSTQQQWYPWNNLKPNTGDLGLTQSKRWRRCSNATNGYDHREFLSSNGRCSKYCYKFKQLFEPPFKNYSVSFAFKRFTSHWNIFVVLLRIFLEQFNEMKHVGLWSFIPVFRTHLHNFLSHLIHNDETENVKIKK